MAPKDSINMGTQGRLQRKCFLWKCWGTLYFLCNLELQNTFLESLESIQSVVLWYPLDTRFLTQTFVRTRREGAGSKLYGGESGARWFFDGRSCCDTRSNHSREEGEEECVHPVIIHVHPLLSGMFDTSPLISHLDSDWLRANSIGGWKFGQVILPGYRCNFHCKSLAHLRYLQV